MDFLEPGELKSNIWLQFSDYNEKILIASMYHKLAVDLLNGRTFRIHYLHMHNPESCSQAVKYLFEFDLVGRFFAFKIDELLLAIVWMP